MKKIITFLQHFTGLPRFARNDEVYNCCFAPRNDDSHNRHYEAKPRQSGASRQRFPGAFSLVELLISLIIISLITSSLAPVLTKKLKYQNATISSNTSSLNCSKFDAQGRCLMCTKNSGCSLCTTQFDVPEGKYVNPLEGCDYKNCATGCKKCTKDGCHNCKGGYGYNSSTKSCTLCTAGNFSSGGTSACTSCSGNFISSANGASSCSECKPSEHKYPNSTHTGCLNKTCSAGQYINGIECKTCPNGSYQEAGSHQNTSCNPCPAGSYCVGGQKSSCASGSVSSANAASCTQCSAAEHKQANASKTACVDVTCQKGQYISGLSCLTCPNGSYQEVSNHQNTSCIPCPSAHYCVGGLKYPCSSNCVSCVDGTQCTACGEGYNLNNGKCEKKFENCIKIGNICVQKFNAGDVYLGGLAIPTNIGVTTFIPQIDEPGGEHNHAYCWIGNGANFTSMYCDAANGNYSGCTRTVCTKSAAQKICQHYGLRLPTSDEVMNFAPYSVGLGVNGLQLCDRDAGYSSAYCDYFRNCQQSWNGNCGVYHVWSSTCNNYIQKGKMVSFCPEPAHAGSVRCVQDL